MKRALHFRFIVILLLYEGVLAIPHDSVHCKDPSEVFRRLHFEVKPLSADCEPNILLDGTESNSLFHYQASHSIITERSYVVPANVVITLSSARVITLKASTAIKKRCRFLAEIKPCENTCSSPASLPNFFTPNGDGYADFWPEGNLEGLTEVKVSIFDRYGKLLTTISLPDHQWDGTYQSIPLPASDYWFAMKYRDCKGERREYKSHFALKR